MLTNWNKHFRLTVEVLSPLHIGNGEKLQSDYDYVVDDQGKVSRIKLDKLLQVVDWRRLNNPASSVLKKFSIPSLLEIIAEEDHQHVFEYEIPGSFSAQPQSNHPVLEQIKEPGNRLYIPGSSMKGLLRTILFWNYATDRNLILSKADQAARKEQSAHKKDDKGPFEWWYGTRSHSPKYLWRGSKPDSPLIKHTFGKDAFHDTLRALLLADSTTVSAKHLAVVEVQRSGKMLNHVEAIVPGSKFEIDVTVNTYGFNQMKAKDELGWDPAFLKRIEDLPISGQRFGKMRLKAEAEFWHQRGMDAALQKFFADLEERVNAGEWIAQLGWGTGWDSKTLGNVLRDQGDKLFAEIVNEYRLQPGRKGRYKPGDTFPATRNVVVNNNQAVSTPGWISLKWEKKP